MVRDLKERQLTGHGWLSHDPELLDTIQGVHVEREATRTRVEEYTLVDRQIALGDYTLALDAATGYVAGWHMLPYILSARGLAVETVDTDPRTMDMPEDPRVRRQIANIAALPFDDQTFDVVCCISTLEHCGQDIRSEFAAEAARVLEPGGLLVVTADNYPGISPEALADLFKEDFDIGRNHGDEARQFAGGKRVAYVIARRL